MKFKCRCFTGEWEPGNGGGGHVERSGEAGGASAKMGNGNPAPAMVTGLLGSVESPSSCINMVQNFLSRQRKGEAFIHSLPATTGQNFSP